MPIGGPARHAPRSILRRRPPLLSASAASLSRLRPSSRGSGIRRSPFLSDRPPSRRVSSSARKCWVVPRRPVAPSMTTPILRSAIGLPLDFSPQRQRGGNPHPLPRQSRDPPSVSEQQTSGSRLSPGRGFLLFVLCVSL